MFLIFSGSLHQMQQLTFRLWSRGPGSLWLCEPLPFGISRFPDSCCSVVLETVHWLWVLDSVRLGFKARVNRCGVLR